MSFKALLAIIGLLTSWALFPEQGQCSLLATPDEILKSRFGHEAKWTKRTLLLTEKEAEQVRLRSHQPVNDRVYNMFEVRNGDGQLIGIGGLLTHKVRTHDQTSMYLFDPRGILLAIELVAFYEPKEYIPQQNWFKKMTGHQLDARVRARSLAPNITGATLSANSFLHSADVMAAVIHLKYL